MNATYFTLGNLPSKYSSQLKHIHLVNIVKHKAVKAEGYAATFAPLVNELKQLFTDGFDVCVSDGHVEKFYAVLCTVSGDNLSSNGLAGFRQVFNSGRVCRMCMVVHSQLPDKLTEDDVMLRNPTDHAYRVAAVKQNPDNAGIYGVTGPSVFSDLEYFETTNSFPPDIMHDCMEGVIPVLVTTIVKRLVSEKATTINECNNALASFPFKGADRTNRPEPLKANGDIVSLFLAQQQAPDCC